MADQSLQNIAVSRHFDASPERVFDAWIDPNVVRNWLFATPAGQMMNVEIDPHAGGTFNFTERRDGQDIEHVGIYQKIDPPYRLAFTFSVPKFSTQFTTVKVDIRGLTDGCELTLTHQGVLPEWTERTKQGWTTLLNNLANLLGSMPP